MGKLKDMIDDISGGVIVLIIAAFVAGLLGAADTARFGFNLVNTSGNTGLVENLSSAIVQTFIDNSALWGLALVLAIVAGVIGVKFFRSD